MSVTAYVTPTDLLDEFGEREMLGLTDVAADRAGEFVPAVAQRGCDRANAELGAALAARYKLPLATVPELLRYLARDLAHFYLYQTEPPSWVQVRFDAARKTLRDIQTGALPLGIDSTGSTVDAAPQNLAQFNAGSKVFARGDW